MDETLIGKWRTGGESSPKTSSKEPFPCNGYEMHFSSLSELEKHQNVHIKKEFECDVCGRTYSWEQNLIRHQKLTKHLSGRRTQNRSHFSVSPKRGLRHNFNNKLYYKNTEASKRHGNSSANKAKANSKVSKNPYACDVCGKVFSFKNYVAVHRRLHLNIKPYKCPICEKEYGLPSSYKNHVKGHKNTNIRKRFSKPPAEGLSDKQKTARQKGQNPFACDICGKVFSNKNYVHYHKRIHCGLKPFKCTLCKMEFRYKSNYNKHVKEQCDASEEKCSVSSLKKNLNDQGKEDSKVLQLRSNITSHAKLHNGPNVRESSANLPTKSLNSQSNPVPCKLCGKTFSHKDSQLVHMRIRAGAVPFTCTVCNLKFRVAFNYRKHIKEMHPNIIKSLKVGKKYVGWLCSSCLKASPSRLDPIRHFKSHRRYGCKKCNKDFALKIDMVKHMKAAHDVKEKLDKSDQLEDSINESNDNSPNYNEENKNVNGCEVCQKTFPDAAALKMHKAAVHVKGKTHVCDVCHKGFKMKVNLARHYTSHRRGRRMVRTSGVKLKHSSSRTILNRCEACKISFTSPSEYYRHRLMHFKCGPHECQNCQVDFKNPTDFGNHMKKVHRSSKPFICNKCDMKCFHYVNLVRHMIVCHENFKVNPLHNRTSMAKVSFNNHDKKCNKQNRNHTLGKENTLENNQLALEQPLIENNNLDDPSNTTSTWKSKTDIQKFPDKQESKPHVCALCKEEFTTYYFMKVHMRRVHKNVGCMTLRKKREPCQVPPKLLHAFECSLCKKRFPSKYLRSKHMRTNHENAATTTSIWIHTCMKCKQMFMKKGVYDEHVKICQSKSDINCRNEDTIGNIFKLVAKLVEEQTTKHKGNRISKEKENNGKNKLQETGAKPKLLGSENIEDFANKSPETDSQKSHKDEEIKVCECPLCGNGFTRYDLLSKHMEITHKISHLFFTCLRCKQLFCKRSSYKEHIKICLNECVMNLVIKENIVKIVGPGIEVTDHRENTELGETKTSQTREREENLRYQETEIGEQELIENAEVQSNMITAAHTALNESSIKVAHNKTEHILATSKMEVNDKQGRPQETKDGKQELLHENEKSEFQANKSEDLPERVFTEDERSVVLDFPEIVKSQEIECIEYESLSGDYENFSNDNENFCDDNQSGGLESDSDVVVVDDDDTESNSSTVTTEGGTLKNDVGGTVTKSNEVETVNDQTDTNGSGIDNCNNTSHDTTLCDKSSKERTRQLSFEFGNGICTTRQTSDKRETEIEADIAQRGSTASHNNFKPSEHEECDSNAPEQNLHICSQSDTDIIDDSLVVPEGKESTAKERCDVSKRQKHSSKCDSRRQTVKSEMYDFVANCSSYQPFSRSVEMNSLSAPNKSQAVPKYVVIRNVNVAYASFYEAKVVSGWMKY